MKKINLKSIKNFAIGFLVGASLLTTGSVYANTNSLEKIQAYLNYDINIVHNGKGVALSNVPITYNGKTYLALTEVGKLTNTSVGWDQKSNSVNINNKGDTKKMITPDSMSSKYGFKKVYLVGNKEYVNFIALNEVLIDYGLKFKPIGEEAITLLDLDGNVVLERVDFEYVLNDMAVDYQYFLKEIVVLGKAE